jgi:hypothetical protein
LRKASSRGFENNHDFAARFNPPLPAVNRFDAGKKIAAGRELFLDELPRSGTSRFGVRPGGENDESFVGRCLRVDSKV